MKRKLLFSISFALLLPSAAHAEKGKCLYLDVSGSWTARQSNDIDVQFDLQQTGSQIRGTAISKGKHLGPGIGVGTVTGTVTGSSLKMTVDWSAGSPFGGAPIGEYTGEKKYSFRQWEGWTFDRVNYNPSVTWSPNREFTCLAWEPEPTATPTPIPPVK